MEKEKLSIKFNPPEVDESLGEILCDECDGRGCGTPKGKEKLSVRCWKCQGDGKVDWVSHITGKPQKPMFGFHSTSSFVGPAGIIGSNSSSHGIHDDALNAISKSLAEKIDEEILDNIINDSNKHTKLYDQEVIKFDNGIVSKQLFHPDFEQELKGKANESFISRYFRRFSF